MSHKFNNIFLIGPMGSGKSAVGKHIAQLASLEFYDSDQEIEHHTGVSVSWIFAQEGEMGFRCREHETLRSLVPKDHIVLATGGGCVVTPDNCTLLQHNGVVVRLQVSIDIQLQRIAHQKLKRPLFTNKKQLQALNQVRAPLYAKIVDLTYCTDHLSPQKLARLIVSDWNKLKIREDAE